MQTKRQPRGHYALSTHTTHHRAAHEPAKRVIGERGQAESGRGGGGRDLQNSLGFERLLEANHVHDVARRSDVQQLHETATWLVNGLERWVSVSETLEI